MSHLNTWKDKDQVTIRQDKTYKRFSFKTIASELLVGASHFFVRLAESFVLQETPPELHRTFNCAYLYQRPGGFLQACIAPFDLSHRVRWL